jgi:hypothetical protein
VCCHGAEESRGVVLTVVSERETEERGEEGREEEKKGKGRREERIG